MSTLVEIEIAAESRPQATNRTLKLLVRDDVLTLNQPVVFPVSKDRRALFRALAWADILLTLDQTGFARAATCRRRRRSRTAQDFLDRRPVSLEISDGIVQGHIPFNQKHLGSPVKGSGPLQVSFDRLA
jgi:hypothetical protein